jgi:hypothetical protein
MNDAQKTLADIRALCDAGDVMALWSQRTIKALARLPEGHLRAALSTIRFHFGADCLPRLLARTVREDRKRYLDYLQRVAVKPITANSKAKLYHGARLFARVGGLCRGRKGFAALDPERFARIQPMGTEAARRKAAERRAAQAPVLAKDPPPPVGAYIDLQPFWWVKPAAPSVPEGSGSRGVARGGSPGVAWPSVADVPQATTAAVPEGGQQPANAAPGRVHSFEAWAGPFCRVCAKIEAEGAHRRG